MKQYDVPVLCPGDDMPGNAFGIFVVPVLRVDGPEDDGTARPTLHPGVHHTVGRAKKKVFPAQDLPQKLPASVHLGGEIGGVQCGQTFVVIGVDADLMALGLHSPHNVLVAGNLLSNEEEGGGHAPLGKAVQQRPRGGPAGAVVKGEGNEFGLLLLLYLRRAVRSEERRVGKECRL